MRGAAGGRVDHTEGASCETSQTAGHARMDSGDDRAWERRARKRRKSWPTVLPWAKQDKMHSVHCEKKSHPETDGIGAGAAPAPPHLNVAGGAWGSRAAEKSTISAAQYTACKSPTLRCGGAGAAPAAFVPVPWYFFSQCTEPHSKSSLICHCRIRHLVELKFKEALSPV